MARLTYLEDMLTETFHGTKPIDWVYDDGGRAETGYKGDTGDCVVRAIAIATEQDYQTVYDAINDMAKRERPSKRTRGKRSNARTGVFRKTYQRYMESIGWEWVSVMGIGTGCTTHLRRDELPKGRIVTRLSKHTCAVIDGVIHDTYDPSRNGTRCVYGYFRKKG